MEHFTQFFKSFFCCSSCPFCKTSIVTRSLHSLIFFIAFFSSIFFLSPLGEKYAKHLSIFCKNDKSPDCKDLPQYLLVYRICFSFCIFFLLMHFFVFGIKNSRNCRSFAQNGCWFLKILIISSILIGFLHLPPGIPDYVLMFIGLGGSTIFVTMGLILLMALMSSFIKWLVRLWINGSVFAFSFLITFFVLCVNILISITIFLMLFYQKCWSNLYFIVINIAISYFLIFISVFAARINQYAGVVQGGVMGTYVMLLTWSAVANNPDESCNLDDYEGNVAYRVCNVIWIVLTSVAVVYASIHTSREPKEVKDNTVIVERRGKEICGVFGKLKVVEVIPLETQDDGTPQKPFYVPADETEDEYRFLKYNWSFNHLLFANALLHLMLLLTNWYIPGESTRKKIYWNFIAMWFKAASSWLCLVIYFILLFHPATLNYVKMILYVP